MASTASTAKPSYCAAILYLHRISDNRMTGSAMRNLHLLKKLCGPDALKNVILVTTMWDQIRSQADGENRQRGVAGESRVLGRHDQDGFGSRVLRHTNDQTSARSLVSSLLRSSNTALANPGGNGAGWPGPRPDSSGQEASRPIWSRNRKGPPQQISELRRELTEAIAARDRESQAQIKAMQEAKQAQINRLRKQQPKNEGRLCEAPPRNVWRLGANGWSEGS